MRRSLIIFAAIMTAQLFFVVVAQQDKLEGRWEGKVQSPQGERAASVTFKKQGENYTGTTTGMRGDEIALKEIKVEGNKITAIATVEAPQGSITINYKFELQGEALKGEGAVDFGGQTFAFTYDLKRASAAAPQAQGEPQPQRPPQARPRVDQPRQKQTLDYFAGQWTFKYLGRESAIAPAPREGTATFVKSADGKSLEARISGKSEAGPYQETAVITFDEATRTLTFTEKLASGVKLQSKADWSTPIAIRFTIEPVKIKGQLLQLKRTINVVAAHSFNVVEELSEDGGPFIRLGQALYTKVGASETKN
jgi:hypothetical protein